eukprot:CAMPEP_0184101838 /NCGR_PEP_ID=MMETSP0974-20121125/13038_1 /TAXON_ID=483370 /ORGANISM="non described non described, Strain CCMP2097" /LENGTH=217 /DNA_ID=CAMNT_0026404777 /DNA_START=122 /DNA_END=771 /DNA_ORIENTATION=-
MARRSAATASGALLAAGRLRPQSVPRSPRSLRSAPRSAESAAAEARSASATRTASSGELCCGALPALELAVRADPGRESKDRRLALRRAESSSLMVYCAEIDVTAGRRHGSERPRSKCIRDLEGVSRPSESPWLEMSSRGIGTRPGGALPNDALPGGIQLPDGTLPGGLASGRVFSLGNAFSLRTASYAGGGDLGHAASSSAPRGAASSPVPGVAAP